MYFNRNIWFPILILLTFSKLAVMSSQIEPLHLVSIRRWYIGTITYYKVIYEKYSKFLKRLCYTSTQIMLKVETYEDIEIIYWLTLLNKAIQRGLKLWYYVMHEDDWLDRNMANSDRVLLGMFTVGLRLTTMVKFIKPI